MALAETVNIKDFKLTPELRDQYKVGYQYPIEGRSDKRRVSAYTIARSDVNHHLTEYFRSISGAVSYKLSEFKFDGYAKTCLKDTINNLIGDLSASLLLESDISRNTPTSFGVIKGMAKTTQVKNVLEYFDIFELLVSLGTVRTEAGYRAEIVRKGASFVFNGSIFCRSGGEDKYLEVSVEFVSGQVSGAKLYAYEVMELALPKDLAAVMSLNLSKFGVSLDHKDKTAVYHYEGEEIIMDYVRFMKEIYGSLASRVDVYSLNINTNPTIVICAHLLAGVSGKVFTEYFETHPGTYLESLVKIRPFVKAGGLVSTYAPYYGWNGEVTLRRDVADKFGGSLSRETRTDEEMKEIGATMVANITSVQTQLLGIKEVGLFIEPLLDRVDPSLVPEAVKSDKGLLRRFFRQFKDTNEPFYLSRSSLNEKFATYLASA